MGAVAGWVDFNKDLRARRDTAGLMSASLKHRGAGYCGTVIEPHCMLINRQNVASASGDGQQPMKKSAGGEEYILSLDGVLYNNAELRAELEKKGWKFFGRSDSEVVLNAYIEWGAAALNKLDGCFAFAVWQAREKTLFLARDRIGVRPLFFYEYPGGIIFGSEIKALFSNPLCKAEIDNDGLKQIFLLGPGKPHGSGIYRGVREICHAEYLKFNQNGSITRKYWRLTAKENLETLSQASEHTRHLITRAVESQLCFDSRTACFLSGGLDSSIISYIAAEKFKQENKRLETLSVDYENNDVHFLKNEFQPDSDGEYIAVMSDFIGSKHKNVVLKTADIANALQVAAAARDLAGMADIDASMYLACSEAKKEYAVCYSGECADEIFGGYPWYHNPELLHGRTFPWSRSLHMRQKLTAEGILQGNAEDFVQGHYQKTLSETDCLDSDTAQEKRLREMFCLNFNWFMQNLLDRTDRMCMQSGLQVSMPFCDYRLVEYAYNLPWKIKSVNGREKGIMREAFRGILPEKIIERKKSPFPKTFDPAFVEFVKNGARAVLSDTKSVLSGILNKNYILELLDLDVYAAQPWYGQLMRLPQLFGFIMQLDTVFKLYNVRLV
ncbi:MAG: asparagine synthase (glutamine-hydrolyzing) [Firmicutes bacterium]|nr:asparagine synthase (glutamine-hydrolyzing) [Bacillota bacterium]